MDEFSVSSAPRTAFLTISCPQPPSQLWSLKSIISSLLHCIVPLQVPSGFIKCWLEANDGYLAVSRDDPGGAELMVPINNPGSTLR